MDKDLERILKRRVKAAKEKKLFEKGEVIATYLGCLASFEEGGHEYISDSICVDSNEIEKTVEIVAENNFVFSAQKYGLDLELCINRYIPGSWEEEFEKLYKKAERLRKKILGSEISHLYNFKKRELKENFGL